MYPHHAFLSRALNKVCPGGSKEALRHPLPFLRKMVRTWFTNKSKGRRRLWQIYENLESMVCVSQLDHVPRRTGSGILCPGRHHTVQLIPSHPTRSADKKKNSHLPALGKTDVRLSPSAGKSLSLSTSGAAGSGRASPGRRCTFLQRNFLGEHAYGGWGCW